MNAPAAATEPGLDTGHGSAIRTVQASSASGQRSADVAFTPRGASTTPRQTAHTATADTTTSPPDDGSHLTVYLLTMGPGDAVWERFGHNAIWIHDALRGTDIAYNWGVFDFEQEAFLRRFLMGRMLYSMAPADADLTARAYAAHDRSVWVQELNLTPEQRLELQEFVTWNERPENRDYRYDYYRDNCSTRVRDALDTALGGQLWAQTGETPAGATYREHTQRLTASDPLFYTALNLAMGPEIDRPLSVWDEMFLPLELRDHIRDITVLDEDGQTVPLVEAEAELYTTTRPAAPGQTPSWLWWYLLIGIVLGAALVALGRVGPRSRAARIGFGTLAVLWAGMIGLLGTLIAVLWAVTDHVVTYGNQNIFQANPFALALVVLVPAMLAGREWAHTPALRLARVVAALSVIGLGLHLIPGFEQVNGEIIALFLPINLGLWWAVRSFSTRANRSPGMTRSSSRRSHPR